MNSSQPPQEPPPRKATLYCPNCGHASLVDGDWVVRARGDCADYECPDCEATITSRPASDSSMPVDDPNPCERLTV